MVAANQIACAGIVRLNFSHNQDIYALNSNQSAFNEKMMTMLRTDDKDFKELEWQFNDELGGEAGASTSFNDTASQKSVKSSYSCGSSKSAIQNISILPSGNFYNVQRLLV